MSMKRKRLLTWVICCLLGATGALAQNEKSALVVKMINGDVESFILSEKPVATFEGGFLKVASSKVESSFPRHDVKEVYFDKVETGIKQVTMNELRFVYQDDSEILLYGLTETDKLIRVYDVNGMLSHADVKLEGNSASINLSSLRKGVFFIKIGNRQSIKIIRK